METTINRIDQFKADIDEMKLKTGASSKEGTLQAVGAILMFAGIATAVGAYVSSTHQLIAGSQYELISLGLAAVCVAITGAAMFLRYSLARFLRLWLLRQMYEGQAHIDQVVEAITRK